MQKGYQKLIKKSCVSFYSNEGILEIPALTKK
jgi:hypothetical protein